MILGFAFIGLAVFVVAMLAISGSRMKLHGDGCDCGDCHRWLIDQRWKKDRKALAELNRKKKRGKR